MTNKIDDLKAVIAYVKLGTLPEGKTNQKKVLKLVEKLSANTIVVPGNTVLLLELYEKLVKECVERIEHLDALLECANEELAGEDW